MVSESLEHSTTSVRVIEVYDSSPHKSVKCESALKRKF